MTEASDLLRMAELFDVDRTAPKVLAKLRAKVDRKDTGDAETANLVTATALLALINSNPDGQVTGAAERILKSLGY